MKNTIKCISTFLCTVCILLVVYAILIKFYVIFTEGVPREYREMNSLKFAKDFSLGINLYDCDIEKEKPFTTNMYGIFMPLLLSVFIRFFGSTTSLTVLQICQIVTVIFETLGVGLMYYIIYQKTHKHFLAFFGSVSVLVCYWRYSAFAGAFPDSYGVTFSILLIFLIVLHEKKGKYNILSYVLVTIILFYIKQYFVFAAVGVFVYLWTNVSFRKALSYFVNGVVLGSISILVINRKFDFYFTETIPMAKGQTDIVGLSYSLQQVLQLSKGPFLLVSIGSIALIGIIFILLVGKKRVDMDNVFVLSNESEERNIYISYEIVQCFCIFPFVVYFAQNGGTSLTYYLQMWYPYVILCGISAINVFLQYFKNKKKNIAAYLFVFLCIGVSLNYIKSWIVTPIMNEEMKTNWSKVYGILDRYCQEGEILVSPHLSNYCLENNIYTSNYGQAEFNNLVNYLNWNNSELWTRMFPLAGDIINNDMQHYKMIQEDIAIGKYACVIITDYFAYYRDLMEILDNNYILDEEIPLQTGSQIWNTLIYVKAKEVY